MKAKKIGITLLIILIIGWRFFGGIKAYCFLLIFHLNSSDLSEARKNFRLRQVMSSAVDMNWLCAEKDIVKEFTPKGKQIIKSNFERGVCLPTGQIILEFLTIDSGKENSSDYLDIVYIQRVGNSHRKIGYFRKFLP